tara:strand:+ start:3449 stop:3805 length:357 start_codon:yes stop_codon:yes gene_type:complete
MRLKDRLAQSFRHAFATKSKANPLTAEEFSLLDHIATKVVSRHMETPMVLLLESVGPMNFLGSQALHALSPLINLVGRAEETDRIADVLERRDSIQQLISLIESKSGKTCSVSPRRDE